MNIGGLAIGTLLALRMLAVNDGDTGGRVLNSRGLSAYNSKSTLIHSSCVATERQRLGLICVGKRGKGGGGCILGAEEGSV
jgi:hypothetical protein